MLPVDGDLVGKAGQQAFGERCRLVRLRRSRRYDGELIAAEPRQKSFADGVLHSPRNRPQERIADRVTVSTPSANTGMARPRANPMTAQAQLEFLVAESCDKVQGYLIGRPQPIAHYAKYVGRKTADSADVTPLPQQSVA